MNSSAITGRLLLALLVISLGVGCQLTEIPPPQSKIEGIVDALESDDLVEREAAAEELKTLAEQGLSVEEGIIALRAAARKFPPREDEWQDSSTDLIRAAARDPRSDYIPVVSEIFPRLNDKAKYEALRLLTRIPDREAAVAYMEIVGSYARDLVEEDPSVWHWWPLQDECRHEDVFFPRLLDYVDVPALEYQVYLLCLRCFEEGALSAAEFPYSGQILESYRGYEKKLMPAQRRAGLDWMWQDDYQRWRDSAALLLDLLGYFSTSEVKQELREALSYTDPRLTYFTALSLLRQGEEVEQKNVYQVASSAEMRNWLYDSLEELGELSLFPEEFRTQEAFAESEMVDWLVYPTELGRVPDEIELMKVVTVDTGTSDGLLDYYVFRFRTHEPHWAAEEGWMAGVSGPFLRKDAPSTHSYGDTFSAFEPWDSRTPEGHVGNIQDIIERWREHHKDQ